MSYRYKIPILFFFFHFPFINSHHLDKINKYIEELFERHFQILLNTELI